MATRQITRRYVSTYTKGQIPCIFGCVCTHEGEASYQQTMTRCRHNTEREREGSGVKGRGEGRREGGKKGEGGEGGVRYGGA